MTRLDQCLSELRWKNLNDTSKINQGTSLILGFGSSTNKAKKANNKNHKIKDIESDNESADLEKKIGGNLSVVDAKKIRNLILVKRLQPMTTITDVVTIHLQHQKAVDGITMDKHTPVVEFDNKKH